MSRKKNKKGKKQAYIAPKITPVESLDEAITIPQEVKIEASEVVLERRDTPDIQARKRIKFSGNDKSVILKNQIITWILTVNSEMDEFVSNLESLSIDEKSKKITQFYSTLLVINKALDGRSQFYGNQVLLKDFGVAEELE